MDVTDLLDKWEAEEELYENLGSNSEAKLKNKIYEAGLLPNISWRLKERASFVKKIVRKNYSDPYNDVKDKLGLRIIVKFKSELATVDGIIQELYNVISFEDKSKQIAPNETGYRAYHYDVTAKEEHFDKRLSGRLFEIQLVTLCMHVPAEIGHDYAYKPPYEIGDELRHRLYRLFAIFEIADDDYENIQNMITMDPRYYSYNVISAIEPYFYKHAKCDYDQELTQMRVKVLTKMVDNDPDLAKKLRKYLKKNESKVKETFEQWGRELGYLHFLSQPEVLLIWYLLDNHTMKIVHDWEETEDPKELRDLAIFWGRPVSEFLNI